MRIKAFFLGGFLLGALMVAGIQGGVVSAQTKADQTTEWSPQLASPSTGLIRAQIQYPASCEIRTIAVDRQYYHVLLLNKLSGRLFIKLVKIPDALYSDGFLEVLPVGGY